MTERTVVVYRPSAARYSAARLMTVAFFPLRISERMSVSRRTLLIGRPQTSGTPLSIGLSADLFHQIRNIGEETIQRRALGDPLLRKILWRLHGIVDYTLDQPQPFP